MSLPKRACGGRLPVDDAGLSGIRESGLCTLERSKVDLANAQVTFRSKRHRGDPPGFIRWETQALGQLEVALLAEILAAKHDPKYVFTYEARGKKGGTGKHGVFEKGQALPDHARGADDPLAARPRQGGGQDALRR